MNDCLFCKIAAGQIKAQTVFEDNQVIAFRDINPQAPVHILVVPKKHIERLSALQDEDAGLLNNICKAIRNMANEENLPPDGFRVVVNEGRDAGQTVDHLHFHLLGGRRFSWPPG